MEKYKFSHCFGYSVPCACIGFAITVLMLVSSSSADNKAVICPDLVVNCTCGVTEVVKQCVATKDGKTFCRPCNGNIAPCRRYADCFTCTTTECSKCNHGRSGRFCDQVKKCQLPSPPQQGSISKIEHGVLGNYTASTVVSFSCPKGLFIEGPTAIFCHENGKWNLDPPKCVKKGFFSDIPWCLLGLCKDKASHCSAPSKPAKGSISKVYHSSYEQYQYSYATLVMFSCPKNSAMVGHNAIYCTDNGVWNNHSPSCIVQEANLCKAPNLKSGVQLGPYSTSRESGTYINYGCSDSRADIFTGNMGSFCINDRHGKLKWSGDSPICRVGCDSPNLIDGKIFGISQDASLLRKLHPPGTKLNYTCGESRGGRPFDVSTCTELGRWSPLPACIESRNLTPSPVTITTSHPDSTIITTQKSEHTSLHEDSDVHITTQASVSTSDQETNHHSQNISFSHSQNISFSGEMMVDSNKLQHV